MTPRLLLCLCIVALQTEAACAATPELPRDYSPERCQSIKQRLAEQRTIGNALSTAPIDPELSKLPAVYDLYTCEALDAVYRWQPIRDQILSASNAVPRPGSDLGQPEVLRNLESSLSTLSSTAHRIEAEYRKPDNAPTDAVANYLEWSRKLFAERGWPVPTSIASVFDELAARSTKPYVDPVEQQTILLVASERSGALINLATDVATTAMTQVVDAAGRARLAEQRRAVASKAAEANSYFGRVKQRARRFSGFVSLLGSSAAMSALAMIFVGRRMIATRRGQTIAFVAGTAALYVGTLLGSGVHVLTGIPGWLGWLMVLVVFGVIYVFLRDQLNARFGAVIPLATHGSAAWATLRDAIGFGRLFDRGMVSADSYGFALGRFPNTPTSLDPRLRFMGHVLTCAPTGSGKGIGAVIPTLLEYPGSILCLDIKGENYSVTAGARRAMGHSVHLVDPFCVVGPGARFNPLDVLCLDNPDLVGQVSALVETLVVVSGEQSDNSAHFNDTTKDLLRGLIVYAKCQPEPGRRTLGEVRRMLTLPLTAPPDSGRESLADHLADMASDPALAFGIPARAANGFLSKDSKEASGVHSTALRHTAFLDDPRIATALSASDFSFTDLKRRPMTVYVVMPPDRLASQTRFMRALVGAALSAITATSERPQYNALFLLDEFAQLGRMPAIEDAISLVRGYGARFWLFVQDLSQLKGVYPKWQTFLANSAKQFFGTADFETAKYVSDMLGQTTVEFRTLGDTSSASLQGGSSGTSSSQQLTARSLLTPDEVMRQGVNRPIVLIQGERPYSLERMNYLADPEYAGLSEPNPFHR